MDPYLTFSYYGDSTLHYTYTVRAFTAWDGAPRWATRGCSLTRGVPSLTWRNERYCARVIGAYATGRVVDRTCERLIQPGFGLSPEHRSY